MHIGEKIKTLRMSKLMTQSELAGNCITRNMLSSIEHGTALPSLPTAMYIAERLNVPVGYLLAQDGDELAYRKMTAIGNIRTALAASDFAGALALVSAVDGAGGDDELSLIRARCEYGLAHADLLRGNLRAAAAGFDRALYAMEHTVYDTDWLRQRIAVCFRYLSDISATITSDVLDADEIESAVCVGEDFAEYVQALERLAREEDVSAYIAQYGHTLYAERLRVLLLMREGDFVAAAKSLEAMLACDELTFGVLLYEVFGDLETCYRKNDDYKKAYEFSGSRIGLLERLLKEA